MAQHVDIKVGASGAGFYRELSQIEHRLGEFKKEVGSTLGTAAGAEGLITGIGAFLGAGLLAKVVSNVNEFAESVTEAADKFDLSTDAVQRLRFAAEMSGKDMRFLEKTLGNMNTIQMDLIKRALESAHPRETIASDLRAFPSARTQRNLVQLMTNLEKLGNIPVMDNETIRKLGMVQRELKRSSETLSVVMGPFILELEKIVLKLFFGLKVVFLHLYAIIADWLTGIPSNDPNSEMNDVVKGLNADLARIQALDEPIEDTLQDEVFIPGKEKLGELPTNAFARIGGIMGLSTDYRIQRLTEEIARNTAETAKNTARGSTPAPIYDHPLPPVSGQLAPEMPGSPMPMSGRRM